MAPDAELNREVALKQILEKHADDPISRQRFAAEAEMTGGLEHPGVVAVYGVGTTPGGRPYYAMRFIKGDSLKEAIKRFHADATLKNEPGRRSLELRKLLRRFMDVCNAIDYAHSRGVLHRDIKPANIIVGKHGETLVVDWGLAKATGRSDPAAEERPDVRCRDMASGTVAARKPPQHRRRRLPRARPHSRESGDDLSCQRQRPPARRRLDGEPPPSGRRWLPRLRRPGRRSLPGPVARPPRLPPPAARHDLSARPIRAGRLSVEPRRYLDRERGFRVPAPAAPTEPAATVENDSLRLSNRCEL